jgi:terminal uridylyltransferase
MGSYQSGPSPQFQSRSSPNSFQNQPQQNSYARTPPQNRQLYQPGSNVGGRGRPYVHNPAEVTSQGAEIEKLLIECLPNVGIDAEEEAEKEAFRAVIESICRATISEYEEQELSNKNFDGMSVEVQCFGSMKSGFATKASDMDLALISPKSIPAPDSPESAVPRLLEKKLLELGYGARLLTRTRVPIIKLCQQPTEKLLSLLREERIKWESGFVADGEEENMESHSPAFEEQKETEPPLASAARVAKNVSTQHDIHQLEAEISHDAKLAPLNQKEHQSVADYYNSAKRLLRKLGGRDITPTASDINEAEGKILNEVCKSFVIGLADPKLAARLRNYLSILPLFDESLPSLQRTLHGIWLQIEGEKLALGWEHRTVTEPNEKLEAEAEDSVGSWRALQNKTGPFVESLQYNRQLSSASDRLKRVNSLKLVFLEQLAHEEPVLYYGRAQKIWENLRSHQTMSADAIQLIVVDKYVSGILNPQISIQLRRLVDVVDQSGPTLEQIGVHHRILRLAMDYEHALKSGMYDEYKEVDRAHIKSYIDLLLNYKIQDNYIPVNKEEENLIDKIRSLPDPTQISSDKPRDRYQDHLEFPKAGVGIQCDINFSAQLAIHNTLLLRCYSHCDPRVKPMILFVKHWAKVRGINIPYRGTLSSYGYVLMVLHYLVNVATPFVLPNLQDIKKDPPPYLSPKDIEARSVCNGRDVRFWRNEIEIKDLAARKMLNHNHESTGLLLRGFFEYYAQSGQMSTIQTRGFDWGREVLSLRTLGGLLTKQEKGWVGAKTVIETSTIVAPPTPSTAKHQELSNGPEPSPITEEVQTPKLHMKTMEETKEVRHRYLFAIEDPFELDHNVARTVTHNGIVSIRDEFRRAWRIIKGTKMRADGNGLLEPISKDEDTGAPEILKLLDLIHGSKAEVLEPKPDACLDHSSDTTIMS